MKRLLELCDAVEAGAARVEDIAELVVLARKVASVAATVPKLRYDLQWFIGTVENVIDDVMGADEEETQEVVDAIAECRKEHNLSA